VPGDDAALAAAVQDRVDGDDLAVLEDAQLMGGAVHLDRAPARGVGHAVKVAVHGHHAVPGDAPLQPQHGLERPGRQRLQAGALVCEVLLDHPARGGVGAGGGDLVQPLAELAVEVAEVPEAAVGVLAHEHRAHAAVEHLGRHAAQRLEGCGVAAQQGLQVLLRHEPAPQHAAAAEHEREQPDHVLDPWLVGEHGAEMREVDRRLAAGRCLEPHLEACRRAGPGLAQEVLHRRVAAGVAEVADLAVQPAAGQVGKGCHAPAQKGLERADLGRARLPRSVSGRLQAALDVFAHRLAVEAGAPRDGGHAQTLPMQIQDHDEIPKPDHHRIPPNSRGGWWPTAGQRPTAPGSRTSRRRAKPGNIQPPDLRRMQAALTRRAGSCVRCRGTTRLRSRQRRARCGPMWRFR